jgi:hypothetical protein
MSLPQAFTGKVAGMWTALMKMLMTNSRQQAKMAGIRLFRVYQSTNP